MRIPHRRPRRKLRHCNYTGKIKYRDEIAAKIALGILAGYPLREQKETRAYRCPFCKGWHLTSKEINHARPKDDTHHQSSGRKDATGEDNP